ncbi:MAG: hypothetical protein FWE47_01225 [Oscillospiraceae bacterium]|nr:hypothetical protein [Oscillospiraceae bacterium]
MKKNWIIIVLGVLLVLSIGMSALLVKNGGTLLPQSTIEPTAEPTAEPSKLSKPTDIIDGVSLYINLDNNLIQSDYEDREVIKVSSPREWGNERIVIFSDTDLYDFKISNISWYGNTDIFLFEKDIFSLDVLTPGNYIEYKSETAETIPFEAISFTDSNGEMHAYVIVYNGYDGSSCTRKERVFYNKIDAYF